MLANISWGSYLTGLGALLAIYYAYIAVRYYSLELKALLNGKSQEQVQTTVIFEEAASSIDRSQEDQYEQVEAFSSKLRISIAQAHEQGLDVNETIAWLQPLYQKFQMLSQSPFRPALDELLQSECSKQGLAPLTEDDLHYLWND